MNTASIEHLPRVAARLQYLEPTAEKPRSLEYLAPPGVPQTTAVYREREVEIRDVRPVAATLSLEQEGFQLLTAPTRLEDFDDEDAIRSQYYDEAIALLKAQTGATRVVVFDHTIRRRIPGAVERAKGVPRQPVPRVHNDIAKGDLVATDLVYPDRTGEIYYVKFNPDHKWFYAPAMHNDEVLLIKCYDSIDDGRARFVPHSAFVDPTTPAGAPPRESIELRTLVFFE
jgi:hypothetical protein